jgi:hypothetical protein
MKTELCKIMTEYGSDKGTGPHNYTIYYHELFKNKKDEKLNIFELGLGTNNTDVPSNMGRNGKPGASLRGWKDYFKNSKIFGADVDSRILFDEDRIKTFHCDQTDTESIKNLWGNDLLKNLQFDIIIEDGLHEFHANLNFMKCSLHKVKTNGIYICEDLKLETVELFKLNLKDLRDEYPNYTFEIVQLENVNNIYNDNNLLVIKKIFDEKQN